MKEYKIRFLNEKSLAKKHFSIIQDDSEWVLSFGTQISVRLGAEEFARLVDLLQQSQSEEKLLEGQEAYSHVNLIKNSLEAYSFKVREEYFTRAARTDYEREEMIREERKKLRLIKKTLLSDDVIFIAGTAGQAVAISLARAEFQIFRKLCLQCARRE